MATPGGDDIATITRLLASADFDSAHDDEQQDKIYEAEDMLFDQSVRADLADGLAYGAANACTTDNSYERVLSLLLTALVVEAQCLEGETTETTNRLSEALCHLIVKHGTSSSSDLNLTAKASDFLTSVLSGPDDEAHEEGEEPPAPKHMQASSISESLLSIARAPVKNDNRGLYGPGLVLAHAAHCAAPPPVDEDEGKWNSSKESAADAYRRDLIDLLGRRVFALGGAAAPATVAEVELCHTLIVGVTKEEFDGAILRPLKFKLMAAPEPTMETLAAFISILTDSGNGNYIESHLAGGTNLVTAALRQVKNAKPKPRADGAKVMGEIARASPGKGATMATQKLVEAVGEVGPGPDAGGLYTALMNVAVSLLESDVGQAAGGLANDVAIPCLEKAVQNGEGGDATDALRAWMELGGRDPSSVPAAPVAAAAAAGVTVGAAAAASHQPPESMDRMEQDVLAKNRGRAPGGAPASRPGAQAMGKDEASRLDDRIAAKQRASNAAGASQQSREEAERRRQRENAKAAAAGLAAGAAVGAGVAAANSSDRPPANVNNLEDDILAKNRARGGKSQPANAPGVMSVDALDERINAKTRAEPTQHRNPEDDVLPGAHRGNEEDAANANRKIFVAGAAAAAAPGPILKDEQAKLNEFSPPSETNIDQKTMLTHGVVKDEPLEDAPDGSSHEPSLSAAPPPMGGGGAGHSDRYADEHTLRQNPNDPRSHDSGENGRNSVLFQDEPASPALSSIEETKTQPKPSESPINNDIFGHHSDNDDTQKPAQNELDEKHDKGGWWECGSCTLLNRPFSLGCEACGALPPDDGGVDTTPTERKAFLTSSPTIGSEVLIASLIADRYRHAFCPFPHGKAVLPPILLLSVGVAFSYVFLTSCRFVYLTPYTQHHVFHLGMFSFLSNLNHGTMSDREECVSYPAEVEFDAYFITARIASTVATSAGSLLLIVALTFTCIPYKHFSAVFLGVCAMMCGVAQGLAFLMLRSESCFPAEDGSGGGYFHGIDCWLNRDSAFCFVAIGMYFVGGLFLMGMPPPKSSGTPTTVIKTECGKSELKRKKCIETKMKTPEGSTIHTKCVIESETIEDGAWRTLTSTTTQILPA